MKLNDIPEKNCPICGADAIAERKDRLHTNGHFNEMREFDCGLRLYFLPNFMRVERAKFYQCKNDPEYKLKINKMKKAGLKIVKYINSIDFDEHIKDDIIGHVKYKTGCNRREGI